MAHPTPTEISVAIIKAIIADDRNCDKTGEKHIPARIIPLIDRAIAEACANA